MQQLGSHLRLVSQIIGHGCGVLGAMFGMDSIATAIDPRYIGLFPFRAGGIEQDAAALAALGMIALAAWLVWASEYRRRRTLAALSRQRTPGQDDGYEDEGDH